MTTNVTVKTHDWPCRVDSISRSDYSDARRASSSQSHSAEFVPANSEKTFAVTDTTAITFSELPKNQTGLNSFADPAEAAPAT